MKSLVGLKTKGGIFFLIYHAYLHLNLIDIAIAIASAVGAPRGHVFGAALVHVRESVHMHNYNTYILIQDAEMN